MYNFIGCSLLVDHADNAGIFKLKQHFDDVAN